MIGRVLVVGGGETAANKVALLLKANAVVKVVAPNLGSTLRKLRDTGSITHVEAVFAPGHLHGCQLVIAATGVKEVDRRVSVLARDRLMPVNVVDDPDYCTFIMPSIVDRAPVLVATSTGGRSPVLARLVRERLETSIPTELGELADLTEKFRDTVKANIKKPAATPSVLGVGAGRPGGRTGVLRVSSVRREGAL